MTGDVSQNEFLILYMLVKMLLDQIDVVMMINDRPRSIDHMTKNCENIKTYIDKIIDKISHLEDQLVTLTGKCKEYQKLSMLSKFLSPSFEQTNQIMKNDIEMNI